MKVFDSFKTALKRPKIFMKRTGMLMKRSETVRNVGRSKFIDAEHDQRSEKFAKSRLRLKNKE